MGSDRSGTSDTRGRSRRRTRVLWLVLLAILALAAVGPASASESSGVAAWGLNTDGQLGNDTTTTEKEAVAVKVLTEATVVAGGELHSLALLKTGKVMAWGDNADGQLGNGTTTTEKEPVEVKGITEAVAIAAGADYSLALLKSGKVMAWGLNRDGQLGNGTTTKAKEPVEVKGITEAVGIAAGHNFSLAVLKSGKVMAWGENEDGQLGNDTTTTEKEPVEVKGVSEASAVAGGEFHSLALLKSGKLEAWGLNTDGQLGNGTTTTEKEPVEVKGISEAAGVAAGHNHSIAVLKSGKVMAWGLNTDGQLGNGTTTTEKEPVEVIGITEAVGVAGGELHSLALLKTGKVMAWGYNNDGQLGNETTTTEKEPVEVKGLTGAAGGISAGANFSLASYATKPANTVLPAISGEAEDERTLTASTGTWTGTPTLTYSYQWESCNTTGEGCASIEGATSSSYTVAHAQVGDTIRVKVTAKNSVGEASASSGQTGTVAAAAPANTVLPAISGEARDERTLTASTGTWRGTPTITYGYQWESCNSAGEGCTTIEHATEATYKIGHEQIGHTIRARVTATNSAGEASAGSAQTGTVAAAAPANTVLPAISGEAEDERTLTASTGTWTGTPTLTYSYQWESCNTTGEGCASIEGATSSSYTVAHAQVGDTIRVKVTAKNSVGEASASSGQTGTVAAAAPANTVLPAISGEARDERTLTASTGTWRGTPTITYGYQWESCNSAGEGCTTIEHATEATYKIGHEQIGHTIRARVTATNSAGEASAGSAQTGTVAAAAPANTVLPAISGEAEDERTLTASTGTWTGTPTLTYSYQWESCNTTGEGCASIEGATSSSYTVAHAQVGDTIRVKVTAKNSVGEASASSGQTGTVAAAAPANTVLPAISGEARDERTLTASTGTWTGSPTITYAYQWESCNTAGESCTSIEGATGSSYTVAHAQVGDTIRVKVTATNSAGEASAGSAQTGTVAAAAPANTVLPAISGEARDERTLTASTGTWRGTPTITYGYQWESCNSAGEGCTTIEHATEATYRIPHGEVGHTIRARVSATNSAGEAIVTSVPTAAVAASAPRNTVLPTISGEARDEQTLTASTGTWTGTPPIHYTYQWFSCEKPDGRGCSPIEHATEAMYKIGHEEVGETIVVRVGATNSAGYESERSAQTASVLPSPPADTALPTISGEAKAERTVSASNGGWDGTPPLTYAYQWESCDAVGERCLAISGATSSRYRLYLAEIGTTLRVLVTASNVAGSASRLSEASAVVGAPGPREFVFIGDFGTEGAGDGQFDEPGDVAVNAKGDIWVLDSGNDRVEEFNPAGEYMRQFGSPGEGDGQMSAPSALAVSAEGDVWVADTGNQRIDEFNKEGAFIRTAGSGIVGATEGIAVDRHGDVWVSATYDGQLVVFNAEGEILKTVGSEGSGDGQLDEPEGLSVDASGHVWVAEWGNNRVQEFDEAGEYLSNFGSAGSAPGEISYPYGITVGDGNVFLAEPESDRVQEFTEAGEYISELLPYSEPEAFGLTYPVGLVFDAANDLLLTDSANNRVEEWAPQESAPANTEAPSVTGTPKDEATLTASTGSWTGSPTITYAYQWESCNSSGESCTSIPDATNSSYMIAHEQVGHTLKVQVTAKNSSGEASETSAQTATIVAEAPVNTALPTISGDTTAEQTLSASTGEWAGTPPLEYSYQWESCDSLGEACLAISGATGSSYTLTASEAGTTLRVVMTAANAAGRASAVSGPSGVVTAAGAPEVVYTGTIGSEGEGEGQFEHPAAVALAPGGDIWVLDQGNDRVEEFSQVGEYLRQFGSEGSGPGQMASPTALAVSPEGDVWVLDTGNQRIEEFNEQGEFIRNAGEGLVGYAEGIAVDRQNDVWVSATYEGHLVVFNDKGEHLKTVGTEGSGSGQLAEPAGLTVDAGGHVWVAEWGNSRVQEFNEAGEYVSQLGVPGFGPGEMFSPYAVVTHDGRVFVAEVGNDRIQEFDEAGKFLAQLGTPGSEPGQLELEGPVGVAINSAEDLWVTDSANNRVEEWTSSFGVMRLRIGACRRGL